MPNNFSRYCDISFTVSGYVTQTLEILSDDWNSETILAGLKSGKLVTTIQENGTVDVLESGIAIANVINVDNSCEYDNFDIDREDYGLKKEGNVSRIVGPTEGD